MGRGPSVRESRETGDKSAWLLRVYPKYFYRSRFFAGVCKRDTSIGLTFAYPGFPKYFYRSYFEKGANLEILLYVWVAVWVTHSSKDCFLYLPV